MRAPRTALAAVLGVALWVAPQAHATPPLMVLSGLLAVSVVPPTATLSTSLTAPTGSLGTVSVVDGRLAATGYTVSVSTAGFDLVGPAVTTSPITHLPPAAATVQVTATTGGTPSVVTPVALPSNPLFQLTYPGSVLSLDLVSSYTLTLLVSVPAQAAQGRYTGVVTNTVV